MLNKELSLFIFEGAKTEEKLVEKLEKNFLGERFAIKCIFDAEIHQLYRKIKEDGILSLDMVNLSPLFVLDYFGCEKLRKKLQSE